MCVGSRPGPRLAGLPDAPRLQAITAVVLAGGRGTRLRPALGEHPKVLAPVNGRPFAYYLLASLTRQGIRRIVLCTGYGGEEVRACLGERFGPATLTYSHETVPLGTGGALAHALPHLESDPVLVVNGDSYCAVRLAALLGWHRAYRGMGTLVVTACEANGQFGQVVLGPDRRVRAFVEKPAGAVELGGRAPGPGWVSAGIYVLARRLLETIPTDRPSSLEYALFPAWVVHGLYGYRTRSPLLDIGTPASLAQAAAFLARHAPACVGTLREDLCFAPK